MNDTVAAMGEARFVTLKPGEPGPHVFLVPGTGGRVDGFADLASLLETAMPVVAIEARGVDGNGPPDRDIEALIGHYIDRVRSVQPHGPYFLMGHSFGGMVVFEMAQRLLAIEEPVGCLMLLDTVVPKRFWPLHFILANSGSRARDHLKRVASRPIRESFYYYSGRLSARRKGVHNIPADLKFGQDAAHMLLANDMLFNRWAPDFYPGRLSLFACPETRNLDNLWRSRVRELETYKTEGSHLTAIERPFVTSLARDMSACLAKAMPARA